VAAQFGHADQARQGRQNEGPWRRLRRAGQPGAADERALVSPATAPAPGLVSIFVGGGPVLVAIPPDGRQAYVTNADADAVNVIDTATATVSNTITVGNSPTGVAITPDGKQAYVTSQAAGTVSVIDTATATVSNTITVGNSPIGVAITPDGKHAYVTSQGADAVSVIDTATVTVSNTITVGGPSFWVAITPDGKQAYVTFHGASAGTVSVIDTATATVSNTIAVVNSPITGVAITPDGKHAYVTDYLDGTVSVIDTATATVSAAIGVGNFPVLVAITPDGIHAYVTCEGAGSVSVIDTATATVSNTITVGNYPSGVAITPDGSHAYVTCSSPGTVVVIPTVPVVALISPAQGPATGDIPVTITGTSLDDIATVNFGPDPATNLFLNATGTELLATAPAGAGTVPVTVTTPGGTSNAVPFSYLPPPPALTGITPHKGPKAGGTQVTITGNNLDGAAVVRFGPSAATGVFFNAAGTQVLATTPAGIGTVPVTVTSPGGSSNALDYTYDLPLTAV
jgi:YVTN family beta-propeller protein